MSDRPMEEHLATVHLKDGSTIQFFRDEKDVRIRHTDHAVLLPKATAQQTFDLLALFEIAGESVEFPEEES